MLARTEDHRACLGRYYGGGCRLLGVDVHAPDGRVAQNRRLALDDDSRSDSRFCRGFRGLLGREAYGEYWQEELARRKAGTKSKDPEA